MARQYWNRRNFHLALLGGAALLPTSAHAQRWPNLRESIENQIMQRDRQQPQAPTHTVAPGRQSLAYAGYSLRYQPVRQRLGVCDFPGAMGLYRGGGGAIASADEDDQQARQRLYADEDGFLGNSELGLMNFDNGGYGDALRHFNVAVEAAGRREGFLRRTGGNVIGFVTGRGDFGPYRQRDFEHILQLNFLALNFLIQGDRRSYNVARRSALVQRELHNAFAEKIAETQTTLNREQSGQNGGLLRAITGALAPEFDPFVPIAQRVPHAYVNPFGPYVSAVVLEIASLEQPGVRGNARAAYEEAAALAAQPGVAAAAARAMDTPATPGQRVVHVIVAESFSPSRQLLRYGLAWNNSVVPLRLGKYTPETTRISGIEAVLPGAARPTTLDPISDIEALVMRDQQERRGFTIAEMLLSGAWGNEVNRQTRDLSQTLSQASFGAVNLSFESIPDMRSWSSLPRRIHVARMVAPAGTTEMTLRIRGGGRVMHTQVVRLQPDEQQSIIYGRITDDALRIDQSRRLWVDGVTPE